MGQDRFKIRRTGFGIFDMMDGEITYTNISYDSSIEALHYENKERFKREPI